MTGIPHEFASRAEFDDLVAALVATGIIDDGSNIYWDVRPSSHVETLEFRVADVCMTIDEAVMIAGLCRPWPGPATRRMGAAADAANPPRAAPRREVPRLAVRAEGDLIDVRPAAGRRPRRSSRCSRSSARPSNRPASGTRSPPWPARPSPAATAPAASAPPSPGAGGSKTSST